MCVKWCQDVRQIEICKVNQILTSEWSEEWKRSQFPLPSASYIITRIYSHIRLESLSLPWHDLITRSISILYMLPILGNIAWRLSIIGWAKMSMTRGSIELRTWRCKHDDPTWPKWIERILAIGEVVCAVHTVATGLQFQPNLPT